jgi:hypothetical protein
LEVVGVVQVIEHLPSKCDALSSSLNITKKLCLGIFRRWLNQHSIILRFANIVL